MAVVVRRPRAGESETEAASRRARARTRPSILVEFLVALVSVILISAAGTSLLEERMTKSELTKEADLLTSRRLSVAVGAYEEGERTLSLVLRYLSEQLNVGGVLENSSYPELVSWTSQTSDTLSIDRLGLFDGEGTWIAGDGRVLQGTEVIADAASGSPSRLVRLGTGKFERVVATPIGLDQGVLLGGMDFADGTAYDLRKTLGDEGEIILVADNEVVGSTVRLGPSEIPGWDPDREELPTRATPVTVGGNRMLVMYRGIAGPGSPLGTAAIGVAVPDPVEDLTLRLRLVRLLSTFMLVGAALVMGWLLFWTLVRPLVGLSRTATRIARGDLLASFSAPRDNEIGRLAEALQQMTGELQGKTRRLQEASKRLLVAQQEERQRVARDLHDGMQQQLVVLAVKIKQLAAAEDPPNPLLLEHLAAEAEEAAFALQDLGRGIFPTVLGDQGVAAALRTSASRLPMEVKLKVSPGLEERRFSPEIEGTLYFVAMEAMANAQKHAPEAKLNVTLEDEPEMVVLKVSDDGPGFDLSLETMGSGLQNMADRINAVGGSSKIVSFPGEGVTVLARIPLDPAQDPGPINS